MTFPHAKPPDYCEDCDEVFDPWLGHTCHVDDELVDFEEDYPRYDEDEYDEYDDEIDD